MAAPNQTTQCPSRNMPVLLPDGTFSLPWSQYLTQTLWYRTGTGQGIGDIQTGWTAPVGAGSRASINMNWTQTVSNPPTQAEVQAIVTQVRALSKALGQLISDQLTFGSIRT